MNQEGNKSDDDDMMKKLKMLLLLQVWRLMHCSSVDGGVAIAIRQPGTNSCVPFIVVRPVFEFKQQPLMLLRIHGVAFALRGHSGRRRKASMASVSLSG